MFFLVLSNSIGQRKFDVELDLDLDRLIYTFEKGATKSRIVPSSAINLILEETQEKLQDEQGIEPSIESFEHFLRCTRNSSAETYPLAQQRLSVMKLIDNTVFHQYLKRNVQNIVNSKNFNCQLKCKRLICHGKKISTSWRIFQIVE